MQCLASQCYISNYESIILLYLMNVLYLYLRSSADARRSRIVPRYYFFFGTYFLIPAPIVTAAGASHSSNHFSSALRISLPLCSNLCKSLISVSGLLSLFYLLISSSFLVITVRFTLFLILRLSSTLGADVKKPQLTPLKSQCLIIVI